MPRLDVDVIVFDILGTMVDEPGGIRRGLRAALPQLDRAAEDELVEMWSRYVDEQQQEILAGRRPYTPSTVIDIEAAARVTAHAGVTDPGAARLLADAALRPDPWPDAATGLSRIADSFAVVGLSNASRPVLLRLCAHAGLRWHQLLSADEARSYKPHPDVYRLAATHTDCPPDRLLMVAAHAWDLRGAQAIGMRTAYVERPVGDPPGPGDSFDLNLNSLDELASALGAI